MKSFYEINKIMCESFFQSKKFSSDTYFNYKKNMYTTSSNRKKRFGETGLEHNGDFLFPIYYHEFGLKKNIDHPVDMAHGIKFTDRRVSNRVPNSPSGIKNEINIFTEPSQVEKLFNIEEHLIFNIVKNISVSDIEENATLIRNWSYGEKIQINIFIYNYLNMTYRICKYNDKITIF